MPTHYRKIRYVVRYYLQISYNARSQHPIDLALFLAWRYCLPIPLPLHHSIPIPVSSVVQLTDPCMLLWESTLVLDIFAFVQGCLSETRFRVVFFANISFLGSLLLCPACPVVASSGAVLRFALLLCALRPIVAVHLTPSFPFHHSSPLRNTTVDLPDRSFLFTVSHKPLHFTAFLGFYLL